MTEVIVGIARLHDQSEFAERRGALLVALWAEDGDIPPVGADQRVACKFRVRIDGVGADARRGYGCADSLARTQDKRITRRRRGRLFFRGAIVDGDSDNDHLCAGA